MASSSSWYEWLCHSNFSFGIGASHPEEYIQRASDLSYSGLGLCDYDGVYGLVRAYRRQQETASKLRLFYGAEVHIQADHQRPLLYRDTLVLYALDRQGYRHLCQILTLAHRTSKREAVLPLETLLNIPAQHLICLQPMRGLIRRHCPELVHERYSQLREHFGSHFYLLLSRHLNPIEDQWLAPTLRLSQQLQVPCLFSQDAYFHEPEAKELSDIQQAIRLNRCIENMMPHLFVNSERCLQPLHVLKQRYSCFTEAAAIYRNSQELAERFQFSLGELRYEYPQEFLPLGYSSQTYLEELTWQATRQQYGAEIPASITRLLQRELELVHELGFADYFLTVWDIVRWARSQHILCQGRGSAANSAICFVLGITSVNPMHFDLLFERFMSRERGDPPDIDVDFEHERREEVLQYIYDRYGRHRAAMVANVITYRSRSAIRFVGKALGIPESTLQEAAQLQELHLYKPRPTPVTSKPAADTETAASPQDLGDSIPWELWNRLACRLKGFPRHMGIHSGGFVITHETLDALCPQEPATMPGRTVIQWSKDDIEHLGIFKIDVLALGMLTVLRKTLGLIEQHEGKKLELSTIPADDAATYQMIQRAQTVGTFQIESRAQMSMLPRLRPRNFYDLVVQIGIIRPGPIQGGLIHPFLRRRKGLEAIVYPDPRLEPILKRTLGVPIFQEQVMRIAITVGSFSPGEADQLRKHIGAWSLNKDWGPLVQKLEAGMRRNGVEEHFVQQILGHLKGFANYGFPESHAASFALLAYASCYLKRHHQAAFYCSLLNSQPVGFYSIHALVQSARREGSIFLPIDVRFSAWDSRLEPYEQPSGASVLAIRLGLQLVSSLTQAGAAQLVARRELKGVWANLADFLQDTRLSRRDLTALAAADALSSFGLERRSALWIAEAVPFAPLLDDEAVQDFGPEHELQRLERDFDSFATSLGEHPTKILRERHWSYSVAAASISRAQDLQQLPPKRTVHIFGLVLVRQAPMTAKGMLFFTLEDETGYINLVFTPQKAAAFQTIIQQQGFLCASGRLQREEEGHSILVERIHVPQLRETQPIPLHPDYRETQAPESSSKIELLQNLPRARNYH